MDRGAIGCEVWRSNLSAGEVHVTAGCLDCLTLRAVGSSLHMHYFFHNWLLLALRSGSVHFRCQTQMP